MMVLVLLRFLYILKNQVFASMMLPSMMLSNWRQFEKIFDGLTLYKVIEILEWNS